MGDLSVPVLVEEALAISLLHGAVPDLALHPEESRDRRSGASADEPLACNDVQRRRCRVNEDAADIFWN